jgi:hypothetical protein
MGSSDRCARKYATYICRACCENWKPLNVTPPKAKILFTSSESERGGCEI